MKTDWKELDIQIHPSMSGVYRWRRGVTVDPTHTGISADNDLWYATTGKGTVQIDKGRRHTIGSGFCMWIRPGRAYHIRQDPDNPLGMVYIHFALINADGKDVNPAQVSLPPEILSVIEPGISESVLHHVAGVCQGISSRWMPRPEALANVTPMFRSLLIEIDAATRVHTEGAANLVNNSALTEAAAWIQEHVTERPDVNDMAAQAGMSRSHFSHRFKAVHGIGPNDYAIKARVTRASLLLTNTDMPVDRIAEALGYTDSYFFCRQFKSRTGLSPGQFRKRERGS